MKVTIVMLLLISTLCADLKVGDKFPISHLKDQFGHTMIIPRKGHTKVIISFEKSVSSGIRKFLEKHKDYLRKHRIVYITDISAVPSFLVGPVVLSHLKKYPYRVALIHDGRGKKLNRKIGKASVYELKNGRIVSIEFVNANALASRL